MDARARIRSSILLAVLLALTPLGAYAQEQDADTPTIPKPGAAHSANISFFIEARLPMGNALTGGNNVPMPSGPVGVPKLLAGVKIKKFDIGLGFDLGRVSTGAENDNGEKDSASYTLLLFVPSARYSILESTDGSVDLYGQLGLPIGMLAYNIESEPPGGPTVSYSDEGFTIGYLVSIGGRFFLHKNFALGAEVGLTGLFLTSLDIGNTDVSTGITSIYGALLASIQFEI